ncbi:helix-turn-helix domain-containing protein [Streptomyces sp. NPDC002044]|uniref:helix-turn-helix domain-containing protein n=1 Tax=Streptomyces sp. NPDC002044 TaxID=3154662 RepID=UPI0033337AAA
MRPHEAHGFREDHAAPRSLAEFLARAGVRERYPHYDLGAAEARLLRATPHAPVPGHRVRRRPAHGWSDPARDRPLDAERARRDLRAVCLAAVCAPKAEAQLASFVTGGHADLPGAVVFGCLLYLAGLREGAGFWWQFAAGSGSARTSAAAYCLFLDHSRRGEHDDARFWARELGRRGYRPGGRRDPREVRLCAQAAVLRYVDQLDDPDLGPVPLPRPGLTAVLAAFHPPAPVPARVAAPRLSTGPLRHPALTAAVLGSVVRAGTGEALAQARRALAVVRVLERHPLGVRPAQLERESGLGAAALRPLLAMLCEEGYAERPDAGVYARGPAHAGAVGTRPLTPLGHDRRAGPVTLHRPDRLAPRSATDSGTLFTALDPSAPGAPVLDLREYAPGCVCPAVPGAAGDAAGSLALPLPAAHAHRPRPAAGTPPRTAVPVLLALLLSGAIPPDAPDAADRSRLSLPHVFVPVAAGARTTTSGLVVPWA